MTMIRSSSGMRAASALSSVVLPVPVPPEIRMFCCAATAAVSCAASGRRQGADVDEVVQAVAARELPNRERRSGHGTRREHRGDARAVLEPRIQHRLDLGDLVAAGARDVLDRDGQIPRLERAAGHALEHAVALDEHARAARVDHHLGDARIPEQILDRFRRNGRMRSRLLIAPLARHDRSSSSGRRGSAASGSRYCGGSGFSPSYGHRDGLRVLQLGEHARLKHVVGLQHVRLAGAQTVLRCRRAPGEE